MSIKIGSISAKDIYIGSTSAKEIRLGSTLIWSRAVEPAYHTLTVNFEGDKEAFSDGYKIYVDNMETELYRVNADNSFEHSFSIPAGSTIRAEMGTIYEEIYTYSETIVLTPWIMDQDYEITVTATPKEEIIYYTINTAWEENSGVEYTDIVFKDPATGEWD
jgi:hypothetical protein